MYLFRFFILYDTFQCVWEKIPVNSLYIYVCNITWRIGLNILRTSLNTSQWHSKMFTMSSVWPLSPLETLWTFGIPPCLLVWAETPEVGNFHVFHLGRWFSEKLCDVSLHKTYVDPVELWFILESMVCFTSQKLHENKNGHFHAHQVQHVTKT